MTWSTRSLRLTLFGLASPAIAPPGTFESIVGKDFDNKATVQKGVTHFDGELDGNRVKVIKTDAASRLDVHFVAGLLPSGDVPPIPQPTFSDWTTSVDGLLALCRRAVSKDAAYRRLAVGVEFVEYADNPREAYAKLSRSLPQVDVNDAVDFRFQINRPRPSSTAAGVTLNRLAVWSVVRESYRTVSLTAGAQIAGDEPSIYMAHLMLDLNTAEVEGLQFTAESVLALVSELLDAAEELAEGGDIR